MVWRIPLSEILYTCLLFSQIPSEINRLGCLDAYVLGISALACSLISLPLISIAMIRYMEL